MDLAEHVVGWLGRRRRSRTRSALGEDDLRPDDLVAARRETNEEADVAALGGEAIGGTA